MSPLPFSASAMLRTTPRLDERENSGLGLAIGESVNLVSDTSSQYQLNPICSVRLESFDRLFIVQ